jgi:hypothetical protein
VLLLSSEEYAGLPVPPQIVQTTETIVQQFFQDNTTLEESFCVGLHVAGLQEDDSATRQDGLGTEFLNLDTNHKDIVKTYFKECHGDKYTFILDTGATRTGFPEKDFMKLLWSGQFPTALACGSATSSNAVKLSGIGVFSGKLPELQRTIQIKVLIGNLENALLSPWELQSKCHITDRSLEGYMVCWVEDKYVRPRYRDDGRRAMLDFVVDKKSNPLQEQSLIGSNAPEFMAFGNQSYVTKPGVMHMLSGHQIQEKDYNCLLCLISKLNAEQQGSFDFAKIECWDIACGDPGTSYPPGNGDGKLVEDECTVANNGLEVKSGAMWARFSKEKSGLQCLLAVNDIGDLVAGKRPKLFLCDTEATMKSTDLKEQCRKQGTRLVPHLVPYKTGTTSPLSGRQMHVLSNTRLFQLEANLASRYWPWSYRHALMVMNSFKVKRETGEPPFSKLGLKDDTEAFRKRNLKFGVVGAYLSMGNPKQATSLEKVHGKACMGKFMGMVGLRGQYLALNSESEIVRSNRFKGSRDHMVPTTYEDDILNDTTRGELFDKNDLVSRLQLVDPQPPQTEEPQEQMRKSMEDILDGLVTKERDIQRQQVELNLARESAEATAGTTAAAKEDQEDVDMIDTLPSEGEHNPDVRLLPGTEGVPPPSKTSTGFTLGERGQVVPTEFPSILNNPALVNQLKDRAKQSVQLERLADTAPQPCPNPSLRKLAQKKFGKLPESPTHQPESDGWTQVKPKRTKRQLAMDANTSNPAPSTTAQDSGASGSGSHHTKNVQKDTWEYDSQKLMLIRHHKIPRKHLFHPSESPGFIAESSLLDARHTFPSTRPQITDNWRGPDGRKVLPTQWTGRTVFRIKPEHSQLADFCAITTEEFDKRGGDETKDASTAKKSEGSGKWVETAAGFMYVCEQPTDHLLEPDAVPCGKDNLIPLRITGIKRAGADSVKYHVDSWGGKPKQLPFQFTGFTLFYDKNKVKDNGPFPAPKSGASISELSSGSFQFPNSQGSWQSPEVPGSSSRYVGQFMAFDTKTDDDDPEGWEWSIHDGDDEHVLPSKMTIDKNGNVYDTEADELRSGLRPQFCMYDVGECNLGKLSEFTKDDLDSLMGDKKLASTHPGETRKGLDKENKAHQEYSAYTFSTQKEIEDWLKHRPALRLMVLLKKKVLASGELLVKARFILLSSILNQYKSATETGALNMGTTPSWDHIMTITIVDLIRARLTAFSDATSAFIGCKYRPTLDTTMPINEITGVRDIFPICKLPTSLGGQYITVRTCINGLSGGPRSWQVESNEKMFEVGYVLNSIDSCILQKCHPDMTSEGMAIPKSTYDENVVIKFVDDLRESDGKSLSTMVKLGKELRLQPTDKVTSEDGLGYLLVQYLGCEWIIHPSRCRLWISQLLYCSKMITEQKQFVSTTRTKVPLPQSNEAEILIQARPSDSEMPRFVKSQQVHSGCLLILNKTGVHLRHSIRRLASAPPGSTTDRLYSGCYGYIQENPYVQEIAPIVEDTPCFKENSGRYNKIYEVTQEVHKKNKKRHMDFGYTHPLIDHDHFFDADFAGELDRNQKPTSNMNYEHYIGCAPAGGCTRKTPICVDSVYGSETLSGNAAAKSALSTKTFCNSLAWNISHSFNMFGDNEGVIVVGNQHPELPVPRGSKFFSTRQWFLKDNVQNGNLSLSKVGTLDNGADIGTKSLTRDSLRKLSGINGIRFLSGKSTDFSTLQDVYKALKEKNYFDDFKGY